MIDELMREIKRKKLTKKPNNKANKLISLLKNKGRDGDTMLAHINPQEAKILKRLGGSGTINPKTGLREFKTSKGLKKALRWTARVGGAVIGNMIMPGLGGVVGGALGGAAGAKNKRSIGRSALKGAAVGATLPSMASMAGKAANYAGFGDTGAYLKQYGKDNSIMQALGMKGGGGFGKTFAGNQAVSHLAQGAQGEQAPDNGEYINPQQNPNLSQYGGLSPEQYAKLSFNQKLKHNSKDFFTQPGNILATGGTALAMYDRFNQPKPLTAAQRGQQAKQELLAAQLTPEEMEKQYEYQLGLARSQRKVNRNKFLPEEALDLEPLYVTEGYGNNYSNTGKWLENKRG